jgi:hypothetical protein
MNKKEVQQRVLQNGKPLALDKFEWDEKAEVFSTAEDDLVLDFRGVICITFNTGSGCTFKTGSDCTFRTGSYCIFKTGSDCTFKTGSGCTFDTGWGCTFKTGSGCTFDTASNCTFDTDWCCIFRTSWNCIFETGSDCTFKTGLCCTFKTGSCCTFKTRWNCAFDTGRRSVVIRQDVFEVIELEERKPIKLNGCGKKGFTYTKPHKITIDGKEIELSEESFKKLKEQLEKIK